MINLINLATDARKYKSILAAPFCLFERFQNWDEKVFPESRLSGPVPRKLSTSINSEVGIRVLRPATGIAPDFAAFFLLLCVR